MVIYFTAKEVSKKEYYCNVIQILEKMTEQSVSALAKTKMSKTRR